MLQTVDSLWISLVALLPGFVSHLAFQSVVPRSGPGGAELVLRALAFGLANAAIHVWWLAPLLALGMDVVLQEFVSRPISCTVALSAYTLLTPLCIGYVVGLVRLKVRLPGMKHQSPMAWDYFFSQGPACVLFATLKDGTRVAGLYDAETGGFASSFPEEPSVYCGKQFPVNEAGEITGPPLEESRGFLLRVEDCILIELLDIPSVDTISLWSGAVNEGCQDDRKEQSE